MKGDAASMGVIFGNLDGENFMESRTRIGHEQTHYEWLEYMSSEFKTPLELGSAIQLLNPEGVIQQASTIRATLCLSEEASFGLPRPGQYGYSS